ncbi:MAG: DUF4342 domain-containing protein [Devosia sp.]
MNDTHGAWKTFTEEVEVAGNQLIQHVTRLVAEGNVRTIRVKSQNGDVQFEIPLTAGVVTGGIVALTAPWLVALGALAGMVAKLKVEVVRNVPADEAGTPSDDGAASDSASPAPGPDSPRDS